MRRSDTIDILRVCMAYIIVIYHLFLIGIVIFPGGGIATEFFFMVTGALMNRSLCKNKEVSVWQYIRKKFSKILPIFLLTTIGTFMVIEIENRVSVERIFIDFFQSFFEFIFLRMFGWAESYFINPVTWYLSATLFSLLLLYPIAKKCRKECADFIFPMLSIALFSYLIKQYGTVVTVSVEYSYFSLDLIKRAIAEIGFGFSIYEFSIYLSNKNFTKLGSFILKIIEIFGYVSVLIAAIFSLDAHYSLWIVFSLGISIAISFSARGLQLQLKSDMLKSLLSEYSLSLYLSHYAVVLVCGKVRSIFGISSVVTLFLYLLFATIVSIINIKLVKIINRWIVEVKNKIIVS